jgi:hypothetical protein
VYANVGRLRSGGLRQETDRETSTALPVAPCQARCLGADDCRGPGTWTRQQEAAMPVQCQCNANHGNSGLRLSVRFHILYAAQLGCSALHRGSLHTSGCKLHTRPGNPLLGTLPPASDVNGQHPTHRYMRPSPSDSTPGAGCPRPLSTFTIPSPSHSHTPPLPHALPHSTSPNSQHKTISVT